MSIDPTIKSLGDTALSIEYGEAIDPTVNAQVMALYAALEAARAENALTGVIETVPSFRALAVHYDPLRIGHDELVERLRPWIATARPDVRSGRAWVLPACYEGADLAPDLGEVAAATGLTPEDVVARHTGAAYPVYILGFVPGFAYLGGVPEALRLPRRASPRTAVPAGSVAIAGEMTGVYPLESPGGWHLLGRCPVPMFDPRREPPVFLAPGDTVRFSAIPRAEYDSLRTAAETGSFDVSILRAKG
ncbi:MAG: 5-oxoprolinase subunit PxpB [Rhodospirillaceae bacterium]